MPATQHPLHTPAVTVAWLAAAQSLRRLRHQLATRLQQALQRQRQHREARRVEQLLMALDDRTLRDLGVTRSELPALAHDPLDATRARNVRRA